MGPDLEAKNPEGETPLYAAVRRHFDPERYMRLLLAHGADTEVENTQGDTVLVLATRVWFRGREAVAAMLEYDADIEAKSSRGYTPLMSAIRQRRDISEFKDSSWYRAVYDDHMNMLWMLLLEGANIHATDADGNNAMDLAKQMYQEQLRTKRKEFHSEILANHARLMALLAEEGWNTPPAGSQR
ncbi:MAG: hypothetical protein L6R40_008081 [Gallowayella cf. fulva]|nr:MAG: hypothetical protein L6R40_008081 [Xanthomendoza cf. fulva]